MFEEPHTVPLHMVGVLQYGPCWCRGRPGESGSFDLYRHRSVRMDLSPLSCNLLIVSERVLNGAEATCHQVYSALPDPKRVISTGPCLEAGAFWDETPLSWVPVSELIPVDGAIEECVSGRPEMLVGAILSLLGSTQNTSPRTMVDLQRAAG